MANIKVSIINESTVLADAQVRAAVTDLETQVHTDFAAAWGIDADLTFVRKGATPNRPGQRSFIGGSMGDVSVIVEGVESDEGALALDSTVHGAGRVMSALQAFGRGRSSSPGTVSSPPSCRSTWVSNWDSFWSWR